MRRITVIVAFCIAPIALFLPAEPKSPGATHPLVTVSLRADHSEIQPGKDLGVLLTIMAGPRGAYLPNFFGDWIDTCQSGFSVDIFTLVGKRASRFGRGCGGDFLGPGPPARELLSQYVFLKPGETRTWHTVLTGTPTTPGVYEIKAEYLSAQHRIDEVAALPEVHGLMVIGHVPAKPLLIRVR